MIPSRRVFEDHAGDYDRWFDEHGVVYQAQLRMLRGAIPDHGRGLEVGFPDGIRPDDRPSERIPFPVTSL